MARYHVIRCPYCKQVIEKGLGGAAKNTLVGSPFRTCPHCGKQYFDERYREPGLDSFFSPLTKSDLIKNSLVISAFFGFGIAMFITSLLSVFGSKENLLLIFIVLVIVSFLIIFVISYPTDKDVEERNSNDYNAWKASRNRLSSQQYREALKKHGIRVPQMDDDLSKIVGVSVSTETHNDKTLKQYGLTRNYPIFTSSNSATISYLNSLLSDAGEELVWTKSAVLSSGINNKEVVCYSSKLLSGQQYKMIYIVEDGNDNPESAPLGFLLNSNSEYVKTMQEEKKVSQEQEKKTVKDNNLDKSSFLKSTISAVYGSYDKKAAALFLPKGEKQVQTILMSLAKIYGVNLVDCKVSDCRDILETYQYIFIRYSVVKMVPWDIVLSLMVGGKKFVKDIDVSSKSVAFTILNINDPSFSVDDENNYRACTEYAKTLLDALDNIKLNRDEVNKFQSDIEFGLIPEKPIYAVGVSGSNDYLNKLKGLQGEPLVWTRRGSISVDGVNGIVDVYDGKLSNGQLYKTVFVNMYSPSTSTAIPFGFLNSQITQKTDNNGDDEVSTEEVFSITPRINIEGNYNDDAVADNKPKKEVRFCWNCGKEQQPRNSYCPYCGVKVR